MQLDPVHAPLALFNELGPRDGPDLTRYLLVCGGLLATIVLLAWGFRRLLADKLRARAAQRSLALIDVLPLGGKRQLGVVRCYDRTFVLGLGEKEVRLIAELDAEVAQGGNDSAGKPQAEVDFGRLLASRVGDGVVNPRPAAGVESRPRRARLDGVVG
jgi:flagellar biogenesis protein FliO